MSRATIRIASALLPTLMLVGCAPKYQRVSVETWPAGAEVYLQRSGELSVAASVAGFHGTLAASSFEEPFRSLGNAPVGYEFRIAEQEGMMAGGPAYGEVTRRYLEGRIRVVMSGYDPVERAVRFTGDPIDLQVQLKPATSP
ncbi:MAG: hypothetical protein JSV95_11815 [Gemmatimonadota bacterium]|jgi:hypothetical protein|nr:MAG: hypothetical protein JSV95_11815 [Gemmatimonadota bacterium]